MFILYSPNCLLGLKAHHSLHVVIRSRQARHSYIIGWVTVGSPATMLQLLEHARYLLRQSMPNSRAAIHVSSHNDIHYAPVAAGTSVLVTLTKIFAMHRVQVVYATETVPIYAQI